MWALKNVINNFVDSKFSIFFNVQSESIKVEYSFPKLSEMVNFMIEIVR